MFSTFIIIIHIRNFACRCYLFTAKMFSEGENFSTFFTTSMHLVCFAYIYIHSTREDTTKLFYNFKYLGMKQEKRHLNESPFEKNSGGTINFPTLKKKLGTKISLLEKTQTKYHHHHSFMYSLPHFFFLKNTQRCTLCRVFTTHLG